MGYDDVVVVVYGSMLYIATHETSSANASKFI